MSEKFNTIMPETTDQALCIMVDRVISEEGYEQNFMNRLQAMIEKHGEIRVLVYYKKFSGWEQGAAAHDMFAATSIGKKFKKIAYVNPPQSEIFKSKIKMPLFSGEAKIFEESELEQAIEWVKS